MTDEAKALVERLRGDWPEILVEKHWMMDSDAIDKQREEAADLIETQAREIERLNAILSEMNDTDVIARTMAENERLREALGWYEKQANDCRKITREGDGARYALDRDGGERARAALEGDSHDQ